MDTGVLQEHLGYIFMDQNVLLTALTHKSYTNDVGKNNERLEFLGDAVLGMAISVLLYNRYPEEDEGTLSFYRDQLVCTNTLACIAKKLDLGRYLLLDANEEHQGGRNKTKILANAMEAIIAAIYLDAGDVIGCVERLFDTDIAACKGMPRGDYKSRLQQLVEQDGREKLDYSVVATDGPVHDPTFHVEARLNSNIIGRGKGHTKQEAEQAAACEALGLFGIIGR